MSLKPFACGEFFFIHNAVFDEIMPRLSANGFKVLCVAIRQTLGWVATPGGDPRNRKEWDRISYSQFRRKSGIKTNATISRALSECIDAGYLLRHQVGFERGKPAYIYSLNTEYELTSSKIEPVTSIEIEPVTSIEIEQVTSSKIEHTKDKAKDNKRENRKAAGGSVSGEPVHCSIHSAVMIERSKNGATWYSHKLPDGSWCKGAADDITVERETHRPDTPCGIVLPEGYGCPGRGWDVCRDCEFCDLLEGEQLEMEVLT